MSSRELQSLSDEQLFALIRKNDINAFELVYHKYWSKLYLSAYNVVRNKQVSEDITQEVLVNLWLKRESLQVTALYAYLYTAVRYQVFNNIRSGKVRTSRLNKLNELFSNNDGEGLLSEKEINRLLEKGIAELPEKCRQVFIMSRKQHLSTKEIAAKLGISPKTVENQLTIALNRLRIVLGDYIFIMLLIIYKRPF